MIVLALATVLLAGSAEPAATATTTTTAPATDAAAAPAKPAKEEVVCRKEKVPGSNLPKRICQTKAQRDQSQRDGREALEGVQRAPYMPQ